MTLAIFLGALVASRFVAKHDGDGNVIWDMLLWVLIPALVGARLYFVFIQSPRGPDGINRYLANPIEILQIWQGGIHIYGALIFGGIALFLYLRMQKLPYARYLDGVALGLTLGQAIGRLGNFINQELYGPPTTLPWGLHIDAAHRIPPYDDLIRYPLNTLFHPLFLYEMIWDGIGFVLLLWLSQRLAKQLRTGDIFLLYLIWIPLGRFFIEFLRTDSWFFPGTPFNTAHILTATAVICGAILLFLRHRHVPAMQQAVESQNSQESVEKPIATQSAQEKVGIAAETGKDTKTAIETQDTSDASEVVGETGKDTETAVETQDTSDASEVVGETGKDTETAVETQDTSDVSEVVRETGKDTEPPFETQDIPDASEVVIETEKDTEPPFETQDTHEHSEVVIETQDDLPKGVGVSSNTGDIHSNASKADSVG
jgi:phosphatidylglycerol:prolipoprotein diacylglycerol transferase